MVEVFRTYPEIKQVTIPEPYNPEYENSSDDQVIRILKYIYSNQVGAD
jgi:hypothetical protein